MYIYVCVCVCVCVLSNHHDFILEFLLHLIDLRTCWYDTVIFQKNTGKNI